MSGWKPVKKEKKKSVVVPSPPEADGQPCAQFVPAKVGVEWAGMSCKNCPRKKKDHAGWSQKKKHKESNSPRNSAGKHTRGGRWRLAVFAERIEVNQGPSRTPEPQANDPINPSAQELQMLRLKNEEETNRILQVVEKNLLFAKMDQAQRIDVANMMWRYEVKATHTIVQEDARMDRLFVVNKGVFEIDDGTTLVEGQQVGDAALMTSYYKAPHTITAKVDSEVWVLDRRELRQILINTSNSKHKEFEAFMRSINLFASLTAKETHKLVDALVLEVFQAGEHVIKQGEMGATFYIMRKGTVDVSVKDVSEDGEVTEMTVASYTTGDYFGERSLIKRQVRAATVTATDRVEVLSLKENVFKLLLGTMHQLFAQRDTSYRKSVQAARRKSHMRKGVSIVPTGVLSPRQPAAGVKALIATANAHQMAAGVDIGSVPRRSFRSGSQHRKSFTNNQKSRNTLEPTSTGKISPLLVSHAASATADKALARPTTTTAVTSAATSEPPSSSAAPASAAGIRPSVPNHATAGVTDASAAAAASIADTSSPSIADDALATTTSDSPSATPTLNASQTSAHATAAPTPTTADTSSTLAATPSESQTDAVTPTPTVDTTSPSTLPADTATDPATDPTDNPADPAPDSAEKSTDTSASVPSPVTIPTAPSTATGTVSPSPTARDKSAPSISINLGGGSGKGRVSVVTLDTGDTSFDHLVFDDLTIVGTLGRGAFGHVQLVTEEKSIPGEVVVHACKTVNKHLLVELQQQDHIKSEKDVMKQLNCPFLVKLRKTLNQPHTLHFLMEPCLGGEMKSIMMAQETLELDVAQFAAACVVMGFDYLHSKNICFRDLKPENLLLDINGYCKMTDFGFAKCIGPDGRTWTMCGTPDYLAPEVVSQQGHDCSVDWWTLGILIYEMRTGDPPFWDDNPMGTYQNIMKGEIDFDIEDLTEEDVHIIKAFLSPKSERLGVTKGGVKTIKAHPWFKGLDWTRLAQRTLPAPDVLIRPVNDDLDLSNFQDLLGEDERWADFEPDGEDPFFDF